MIESTGVGVAVGVASGMGLGELVLLGFALPLGSPPSLVQAVAATKNTQHRSIEIIFFINRVILSSSIWNFHK